VSRDFARTAFEPAAGTEPGRPRDSWFRAALKILLVVAVMPVLALGVYLVAGSGSAGAIAFGPAGVDCAGGGNAGVFMAGEPVFAAIEVERTAQPGELLTVRLVGGTTVISEVESSFEGTGPCDRRRIDAGPLEPGRYRVLYFLGEELIADGDFEVIARTGGAAMEPGRTRALSPG
jgi:hypothetical protein